MSVRTLINTRDENRYSFVQNQTDTIVKVNNSSVKLRLLCSYASTCTCRRSHTSKGHDLIGFQPFLVLVSNNLFFHQVVRRCLALT